MQSHSDLWESLREPLAPGEDIRMTPRLFSRWLSGFVAILIVMAASCEPAAPPAAETPPPPVSVSKPVVRQITDFDDYEGRIGAGKTVEIRARVRGHLLKVHFQDGAIVKEGDLLYEIDPRPAKATLGGAKAQEKAAQASLQFAKSEYNRTRSLLASGASNREELETWAAKQAVANGDVLKAKAAVEQAQLDLDFCQVTAPIAGKMSRTQVDEGNLINAGGGETLLTTLVTIDPIYVYFNVDERSLLRYRERYRKNAKADEPEPPLKDLHIPVYVALEGETDYPHKGEIDFAENRVNPSTGTIQARGILSNTKRIFDDGMRARVRIPIGNPYQALMVTERAIANDQGRKFVFVVNEENTVQRRDIELGRLADGLQVIQQGLQPDAWVVVNGIQRVREGMKVEPNRVPMPGTKQAVEAAKEKLPPK
jgi:multidrug efflux system membrane fusion protein